MNNLKRKIDIDYGIFIAYENNIVFIVSVRSLDLPCKHSFSLKNSFNLKIRVLNYVVYICIWKHKGFRPKHLLKPFESIRV